MRGERPTAVVLHGVGSTADFAHRCLGPALVDAGYVVVAPALRGHVGAAPSADPRDHAVQRHVDDLAELATVYDVRLVAGISLGAEVALHWAARRPAGLDALVLCLPGVAGPASAAAAANRAAADGLRIRGRAEILDAIAADRSALPWVVDEVRTAWQAQDEPSLIAALDAAAAQRPLDDVQVARIDVPVGVVGVTGDAGHPLALAESLVGRLARAALEVVHLEDLAVDRSALGRAGQRAARAAGWQPPVSGPR